MESFISIQNWEKYQARTDKDLPWCKLWGSFFDKFWWLDLDDKHKIFPIIFLDLARKFGNRIPEEAISSKNLSRSYGVKSTPTSVSSLCNLLVLKGFLSDNSRTKVRQSSDASSSLSKSLSISKSIEEKIVKKNQISDDEFLDSIRRNPAYEGIDVDRELSKMDAWLLTPKGMSRKKTRKFIVSWLNRIDKPMQTKQTKQVMNLTKAQISNLTQLKELRNERGHVRERDFDSNGNVSEQGISHPALP